MTVADGLRLEYVQGRKVLRLLGLSEPVEIPVETLVSLGVNTHPEAPWQFLVFGGRRRNGGSKDLLGVYRTEPAAREVFHSLRAAKDGWGEVVKVGSDGAHRLCCWFDDGGPPGEVPAPARSRFPWRWR